MSATTDSEASREILSSRLIDAPREKVFQAFSTPVRLARWWGPSGFRNTIHEFDFRPGGSWRLTMHGPDGRDWANRSVFLAIEPAARIEFEHVAPHRFRMTITLADEAGKTRVGWRMLFESASERNRVAPVVLPANEQNLDRLEAELARGS